MLHTTIIHELRVKYGLSISEFCVLEAIAFLCLNPESPVAGWCCASKAYISTSLGLSKAFVVETISTLNDQKLIEKSVDGRLLRITVKYFKDRDRHKTGGRQSDRSEVIDPTDIGNQSDRDRSSIRPPSNIYNNTSNEDSITLAMQVISLIDVLKVQYGNNQKHVPLIRSPKRLRLVEARIKDFEKAWPENIDVLKSIQWVFEYKAKEWSGTDMWKYFKAETLLSAAHFIDYCEQCKENGGVPPLKPSASNKKFGSSQAVYIPLKEGTNNQEILNGL